MRTLLKIFLFVIGLFCAAFSLIWGVVAIGSVVVSVAKGTLNETSGMLFNVGIFLFVLVATIACFRFVFRSSS